MSRVDLPRGQLMKGYPEYRRHWPHCSTHVQCLTNLVDRGMGCQVLELLVEAEVVDLSVVEVALPELASR